MTTRRQAYFGSLKFFFQAALIDGKDRHDAWKDAKNFAAVYAFAANTEALTVWVPVWNVSERCAYVVNTRRIVA